MARVQDFDLAGAAHVALERNQPPSMWDARLRQAVDDSLVGHHYRENRFLLALGAAIAVLSLVVDAIAAPHAFAKVASFRLAAVLPLAIPGLFLPRNLLGLQKMLIGLSITGFAVSIAYASLFVPSPANPLLTLGVVTLMGLALPVLPFRRWELLGFVLLYVTAVGGFLLLSGSVAGYAEIYFPIMILTTSAATILAHRIHWIERRSVLLSLEVEGRAAALEESNARLTELSMKDPLTGLANRRRAEITFQEHYAVAAAPGQAGSAVLMLDLDHFKAFNDRWGHQAGDSCLRAAAEVMRHTASRHGGLAARFGGEEFVVLLRANDEAQARAIAEELRIQVERIEIVHESSTATATCTTSVGIALHSGPDAPDYQDMLARADTALYRAKAEGRNRCVVAD